MCTCQMEELETLDYVGLAVAFSHENTIAVGTSEMFLSRVC